MSYITKSYHRNILENLLEKHKHLIKGKILDIGSKNRRYDYLFNGEITAIDTNPRPEFNVIEGNLINLNFKPNSFDSIICFGVFEYLEPIDFKKGFEEIHRVLTDKGYALISIPFFCNDHMDYMRVTYNLLLKLLKNCNRFDFTLSKIGNKYTAIYDIVRDREKIHLLKGLKKYRVYFVLFLLYLIIKLFSLENKNDSLYSGIFLVLIKK